MRGPAAELYLRMSLDTRLIVCIVCSGNLPLVSGERFSSKLDLRCMQSWYQPAIVSALWLTNPSRQNQLCMGGIGLYGGPIGIQASMGK